ncbi:VOC family protein [Jatrophihabitans sp. YIM 134969]
MDQRLSFITLAVPDLARVREFYLDGLGWTAELDIADSVVMIAVAPRVVLSLWAEAEFEDEVGPVRRGEGVAPMTLAHNVATREEVDTTLAQARAAGASQVRPATDREWGGYSGYFCDPAGFWWEVAWNPGPVGRSVLP